MLTSYTEKENLSNTLNGYLVAASILSTSSNTKDAYLLENILRNLHKCRHCYPQKEKQICRVIFKVHDMAYYGPSEHMHQRAHVAAFCGFSTKPTQDMSILKELLDRMALVKNPKNMSTTLQSITHQILQAYVAQNYQQKDNNLTVAYRLKGMILALSKLAKTRTEKQWLNDNAQIMESIHPSFKDFSKMFPAQAVRSSSFRDISFQEPALVYRPVMYLKTGNVSYPHYR